LVLWRISELLLYLESFARRLEVSDAAATLALTWQGLTGRRIGHHDPMVAFYDRDEDHICHQEVMATTYSIARSDEIKANLVTDVQRITVPLFESFDFFSITEEGVKGTIKQLFDADKEGA